MRGDPTAAAFRHGPERPMARISQIEIRTAGPRADPRSRLASSAGPDAIG